MIKIPTYARLWLLSLIASASLTACATSGTQEPEAKTSEQKVAEETAEAMKLEAAETAAPLQAMDITPAASDPLDVDGDLWETVRASFELDAHPEQSRVNSFIEWNKCHPDYLQRVTARGEPYLHLIMEEIKERGMPGELVMLPAVESAFVPFAYSHGRAAGIWQFIPSTGRHFGLEQNWWYDGRRDIYAATVAALDYLQQLNKSFDGDWLLAIAAYNAGAGNVRKAIRKNERAGKPTDFWHLDLPKETQFYVPKLLAMAAIVQDPDYYGLELWPIDDKPYLVRVETDGQIDLAVAANLAGIDLEQMYQLNPAFNRWATAPDGPHYLLLPIEKAATFSSKLQSLPAENRVTWLRHKIGNGETLGHIAKKHHTTVAVLKEVNGLRSSNIRAGKYLLVPTSSKPVTRYALSSDQRLKKLQNKNRSGTRYEHVVQSGDTLWDLSRTYGVSTRKIAKWNGMAPGDTLKLNQKLVLWKTGQTRTSGNIIPAVYTSPASKARKVRYTVRKGDSLYRIASRFKVSINEIRRWNNLGSGSLLRPGQKLTLKVDITRTGS
jgi:membrane-bound lytic murein transglycosylase D